jgi:hypothetical protein
MPSILQRPLNDADCYHCLHGKDISHQIPNYYRIYSGYGCYQIWPWKPTTFFLDVWYCGEVRDTWLQLPDRFSHHPLCGSLAGRSGSNCGFWTFTDINVSTLSASNFYTSVLSQLLQIVLQANAKERSCIGEMSWSPVPNCGQLWSSKIVRGT